MRFFYFLARNISYTFALAFFTIFLGWIGIFFGVFLGNAFFIISYDTVTTFMYRYIPISTLTVTLLHLIHFGFFTPIKIPAFLKSHRLLNYGYKKKFKVPITDMKKLYGTISDIPMYNFICSILYVSFGTLAILGFAFYEHLVAQSLTFQQLQIIFKILPISLILVSIFYGMSTYLLSEAITVNERASVYNELLRNGIRLKPRVLISIRLKFVFFIILMLVTLLSFAALLEKGRFYQQYRMEIIIIYFVLSFIVSFTLMQVTTRSILKIINDMIRVTKEISSGGRAGFEVLSLEKEFAAIEFALMEMAWEIDDFRTDLEGKVEKRTNELQDALSNLKGKDDMIQKQLDMASVIQRSILPGKIEDWNELKFSVRYIAMEKIGGDFYDVYQLKDDKLGIMIADVSGHGIPAALVTTMAKISFGNAGSQYDSPRRIFQEVNQNILNHVKTQDYMTCFMIAVDDEYNVVYSNASHQKAILLRTEKGEIELLDTDGLFIGAIEEANDSYSEKTTKLKYGDRLILYTDGIPEALNEKRKEYSNNRLEQVIMENKNLPLEEFSDFIIRDAQNYIGNAAVVDDITLLIIELARDEAIDLIKNAKKLVDTHKYNESIELLEKGLKKFKGNQKILYNLSKNYFKINDYKKSNEYISKYIEHDKRNKYAFYISGSSYYQLMEFKKAIDQYERALDIDSNFVNAMFAIGMAYKKMNNKPEAVKTFEKVVNIDPDNKMALFELRELREGKI